MVAPTRNPPETSRAVGLRPTLRFALLLSALALACGIPHAQAQAQETLDRGRQVYDQWCASCHGFEGAGDGPAAAWMLPRPRDFTRGLYQIRTTAGGDIPADADIMRIINEGMPGTTMPGWEGALSRQDREALVGYLKSFYPPFETMPEPEVIDFPRAPRSSDDRVAEGRRFYEQVECWVCHGQAGRGDGESAPTLEDDWGNPIRVADLTRNWRFNGGGSVDQIYRRLRTGLDGTPMAAFWDLVESGFMTDDELWSLAHYVRSLSPDSPPRVREVILGTRVEPGELPTRLDDEIWDRTEAFHIPLVSQIIIKPRWFDNAVDAVSVEVLHDDEEVVFRLTWHDRSRSPDPGWEEWQAAVIQAMQPEDDSPMEPGPRPDRITVQFPVTIPEGMDRPFFLMGDARSPVYLWQWRSDEGQASQATAQGMTQIQPFSGATDVVSESRWENGRWQVLLRRPLRTEDPSNRLQFETGVSIPVAFFAWDGDNGEDDTRGAISSWYYVHLQVETPVSTYVTPLIAFLLTGGLGVLVVARAQRRESSASGQPEPEPAVGPALGSTPAPRDPPPGDGPGDGSGDPPETGENTP